MIRPIRRRHRATVCTLAVLLPVAFAAGIAARRPVPVATSLPTELSRPMPDHGPIVWTKADLWPGQRIIASLRRGAAGSLAIELMFRDLVKPDVLVYWVAGNEAALDRLPDHARLLGALSNRTLLSIPPDLAGQTGRVVLYSLADHEIVAISKPFTF